MRATVVSCGRIVEVLTFSQFLERLAAIDTQNPPAVGVVLGPGSLEVAHQPDGYVRKDDLVRAALIYRDLAALTMRP